MTTNDGIRSQTMIRPSIPAIAAHTAMPTTIAAQVGNGLWTATIQRVTVPPIPALKPSDRSISPSSSGNVCAMAIVMMQARLRHQVRDVARGQERVLGDLEVRADDDQADDDRQRAALTAADPPQPDPGVFAQRVGHHLGSAGQRDVLGRIAGHGLAAPPPRIRARLACASSRSASVMSQPSAPVLMPGAAALRLRRRCRAASTRRWSSGPPRTAGQTPRPARPRPACPGRAPRSGPRPGTRRSGCARSAGPSGPCSSAARSGQHQFGLGDAERGGRLVHDDELGVLHHGLGHRDRLPLPAG